MKEIIIKASDGLNLSCLIKEINNPKACIQIIHGMCEHKERYIPFINFLNSNGYSVIISDNRGHGKSVNNDYPLGYIGNVDDLVSDQYEITKYIKGVYPGKKLFIFAHSMGTLIARAYIMRHDNEISGLMLSGTVYCNPFAWLAKLIAKFKCIGNGKMKSSSILYCFSNNMSFKDDTSWLSYDKKNIEDYNADSLCGFKFKNLSYLTLFSLDSLLTKSKKYQCLNPDLPIISMSGKDDRTTNGQGGLKGIKKALNKAGYSNIVIKEYTNMKHEILNEADKELVYNDVINFLGVNI
ncbi:MAG: alpha/beta fold hydrolase [Anaeroplasma sp.]